MSSSSSSSASSSSSSAARAPLDDDVYFNPATAGLSACGLHCTIELRDPASGAWYALRRRRPA